MKVCIEDHLVAGFGRIPVGSLWDDDSPYAQTAGKFADVDAPVPAVPVKRVPVRKFAAKPVEVEGDDAA